MPVTRRAFCAWLSCAALCLGLLGAAPARAQVFPTCTASATPITVSSAIDPVLGGDGASTGAITVQCSGVVTLLGLAACVKISPAPGASRVLTNGAASIAYTIYQDSSYATAWGDTNATGRGINFTSLVGVAGTQTATAYLKVINSATAVPGHYTATANVTVSYSQVSALLGCNSLGLGSTTTTSFLISADVRTRCTVSAAPMTFPATGLLSTEKLASADVTARCTNTTPYTIALDLGQNSSGTSNRYMKRSGDNIRYELYRDAARSLPWGSATGVDTQSAVGTGLDQKATVYGRVPPQAAPQPGTYTDRVVVTVSY